MIEQFLQVALEFVKEIWFQLDSQFGLEETEAFKFIHPHLLQLQDNPTYIGIAFAVLVLVPIGLYKVRSISREREQKLDELMEEMEEMEEDEIEEDELDEDDPSRLRRPAPDEETETAEAEEDYEEGDEKSLLALDEDDPPQNIQIPKNIDEEESEDELHIDTQKVMGEDNDIQPVSSELAEPQINNDLSEFEEFEFDSDPVKNDSLHDQANKELQEDGQLTELKDELSPDDPLGYISDPVKNDSSHDQAIQELQEDGQQAELEDELSPDDPLGYILGLENEEQDRAIQKLQDEMESTINKKEEQLENTPETMSTVKDLGDIRIGDGAIIDEEYTSEEELSLKESPDTNDPAPEPLSLEALGLADEVESAIENIEPVTEGIESKVPPLQPVPERDYAIEEKPDRQVDSLINRLKYFQENLDTRFHHSEKRDPDPEHKLNELVSDPSFIEQQDFVPKAPKVSPVDNKKYMEILESFIFLKDQNKH
jgi:hypothetical protein